MMAQPYTQDGEKLDVMSTLIQANEAKHFPMELPNPGEAIKFEMERKGLTVRDLEPMIGKSNRVYEVLNYKRALTLRNANCAAATNASPHCEIAVLRKYSGHSIFETCSQTAKCKLCCDH